MVVAAPEMASLPKALRQPPSSTLLLWSQMTDKPNSCVKLNAQSEEVIRIDSKGFHYRGQFIADAGEAHRLMVAFLQRQPSTESLVEPDVPTGKELRETYLEGYYACKSRQGPDAQEAGLRAVLERWG